MIVALGVAAAGALGALARYVFDHIVTVAIRGEMPWGTLAVNVSGSFAAGIVVGLALHHGLAATTRTLLATGLLGGYTTFSTFAYETIQLAEGSVSQALLSVAMSVSAGIGAAALGLAITS